MFATEDIRDVFAIFHDGGIAAWSGDHSLMRLTIDCEYLAQRIDRSFTKFYVELRRIDELSFSTWPNPPGLPVQVWSTPEEIFKEELELLTSEIKDGKVLVSCYQRNSELDYMGGVLTISGESVQVFDQQCRRLTIDELDRICKEYWEEWSTRSDLK